MAKLTGNLRNLDKDKVTGGKHLKKKRTEPQLTC